MKIAFDINHPADVHTFKYLIKRLNQQGHETLVTARHSHCSAELLVQSGIDFLLRSSGSGLVNRLMMIPKILKELYSHYQKFQPDLLIGASGNLYIAQLGRILGKPGIILDDTEHAKLQNWLTFPFATTIWTPACFRLDLGQKQIRFNGSKELAYLHPNVYQFQKSEFENYLFRQLEAEGKNELKQRIQKREKPLILLRMVAWDASHDLFKKGLMSLPQVIKDLSELGTIILSTEDQCPPEFEQYNIQISANRFHDLIAYCDFVISEGATTAAEAAVLGKPTIYCNVFELGYIDEYDQRYNLIVQAKNYEQVIENLKKYMQLPDLNEIFMQRHAKLLREREDITEWMYQFLEKNYFKKNDPGRIRRQVYQIAKVDPRHAPTGGIENYLATVTNQLRQRNFQINFIGLNELPKNGKTTLTPELKAKIQHSRSIYFDRITSVFNNFRTEFATNTQFLWRLCLKAPFLKINPTHLMHFHRPDFALPFIFFSNPKVCTIHGEPGELIKVTKGLTFAYLYNFFERLAIRSFKRLIFVSESALKYYQKKFPDLREQMQVIPPAIDSYFIRQSERDRKKWREKNGWSETDKILLFVGRLEKEKQLDKIIQNFHKLRQVHPAGNDFRLLIIGEGRLKEAIEKQIEQCGDSHIHLMGFYPKSELPLVYTSVDATIIYSMSEGLPGVVLESLACGTPVVANQVGDLPQLIEHGKNGYLVDANSLKDGIILALENSPRLREACIVSIEKYRVDFIMNKLVSIYENELSKTNKES